MCWRVHFCLSDVKRYGNVALTLSTFSEFVKLKEIFLLNEKKCVSLQPISKDRKLVP